ncbi:MAG: exo-alpha-sialidase [Chitinophagaceae bacterium]|nr:exo-alpha-sialidase [Chitinophagaceae bacterium]MCW5926802.1 exo-alpha-sialidase [Chitinophagaceae bacterium]
MKIISRGIIPTPGHSQFNSNTFPYIQKLPSGRWLAAFKASEKKGDCDFMHAVICWSDDEGASWSTPFEPVKLPDINGVPGQSRTAYFLPLGGSRLLMVLNWVDCSDTLLPYYDPAEETLKDTRIFYCFSDDEGASWSVPQLMTIEDINDPVPLTGSPLMLKDETIVCQFEINKSVGDPGKWIHRSAMVFSYDGGNTWKDPVMVTEEKNMYYWDQRPQVLADGTSIIDFFWTLDGVTNQYKNIHARLSEDGGRTWGDIWDTGVYGQPGQPVVLEDGRLMTVDIDRSVKPVVTVRVSEDSRSNFEASLIVYEADVARQDSKDVSMNDAWAEMVKFSVGQPGLLYLGDNKVLAYYYAGDDPDNTNIEFVKIAV